MDGGLGSPPPPSYLWDVLLEVGQVRLHDGGIPEGEASVELTLRDVPIGIDSATLAQTIRENLQADPQSLLGIASTLVDGTVGEADLYYLRDRAEGTGGEAKDWLFFIGEEDLRSADPAKEPGAVASRRYAVRGFFADEALQQKVSSTRAVAGDTTHEKVEVTPGTVLYSADDKGAVFRITIGPKARASRLNLSITRIR